MLKRLIEVALPLKEVSEHSAQEKTVRHGHISNLHLWWARQPLAACRAAVFASLIPDPNDPECPKEFRSLVMELLKHERFRPNGEMNGQKVEDSARNRCLEFIKHLVKWENSNNPEFIEPARKLIVAAHKFLHPGAEADAPKVLDPFAGGGAIPLEALRLGCEAHAIDLNPVAHLIELCTLVYPPKFGQPDSRPVPDYIRRLISHNCVIRSGKGGSALFAEDAEPLETPDNEITPDVDVTEAEYRKNPLAADVKFWGHWTLARVRQKLCRFYPSDDDGRVPFAYLWCRTVPCANPKCRCEIPLYRQSWLSRKGKDKSALRIEIDPETKRPRTSIHSGPNFAFDPDEGTIHLGRVSCPQCGTVHDAEYLQNQGQAGRIGQHLMAVATVDPKQKGKRYRLPTKADLIAVAHVQNSLKTLQSPHEGLSAIPDELVSQEQPRILWVQLYGCRTWGSIFTDRQKLTLCAFASAISDVHQHVNAAHGRDYADAVCDLLGLNFGRLADLANSLCRWEPDAQCPRQLFARQALPMVWDFAEGVPISEYTCSWANALDRTLALLKKPESLRHAGFVQQGTARRQPFENGSLSAIITDPPYYDAVPYSDLSDFFYVWLKRALRSVHPGLFRSVLTPKSEEIVEQRPHKSLKTRKTKEFYEQRMLETFAECHRTLDERGVLCVMFAHKSTTAWEALIAGLIRAGLVVTSSWPIHTEMKSRMVAQGTAALASSVTLVCRSRSHVAGTGLWDDIRKELQQVAKERLDFFWSQGIRGADFFISAIGPALSVFGKYEKVTKLSGEEVTVGQFLDEVRGLVTNYALAKILKTTHTANIDPESRFYVVWKWSYGEAKVPADESFKLAQALGMDTDTMWDRTGVLEKSGENVQAVPVAKRMKIKDLGEPNADSTPASLIDVLHSMCVFRDKGDTDGMAEFLGRSGQGKNPTLWLVAQAVSEILPDGDKEKQLMQGLLNQREKLEQEEGRLF
jgi:adenine-specific DNA methylase